MMSELGLEAETVSPPIGELVEHIWREAMGELESIISVSVNTVKLEQVSHIVNSRLCLPKWLLSSLFSRL